MWVTADNIHLHGFAAEAKEEKSLGYSVNDDVERIGGGDGATEYGVGNVAIERKP